MSSSMTAVVQYDLKPGSVEVREMAIPEIGEDEVLLQVGAVSVCVRSGSSTTRSVVGPTTRTTMLNGDAFSSLRSVAPPESSEPAAGKIVKRCSPRRSST